LLFKLHLGIEIVLCRLLQRADSKGGHGFKLEKVGPTFLSFNVMQKIVWLVLPDDICLILTL